jgi:hypothetical protein
LYHAGQILLGEHVGAEYKRPYVFLGYFQLMSSALSEAACDFERIDSFIIAR